MICSRCRKPVEGDPLTSKSETPCKTCEPQDASVVDFLWQFPASARCPEVMRHRDWFFRVHEHSVVAVADDAWPTLYDDERFVRIHERKFPAVALYLKRVLEEPPVYTTMVKWAKLKKAFAADGLVRFFGQGIEVSSTQMRALLPLAFAEAGANKGIAVDFVEIGLRFYTKGIVVVLPLAEATTEPVAEFAADMHTKELAETAEILDQLDTLLA